jgi:hypothetical protein
MGAFEQYISTQLKDVDISIVGWIFSLYASLAFEVGLFVGPLFDKCGPKWLILSGSVLVVLSMDLIGNCTGASFSPPHKIHLLLTSVLRRILAIHSLLLSPGRHRLRLALPPFHRHSRPLLQLSSRLRNWHSSNRRRLRRDHLPSNPPIPHSQHRLPLVHQDNYPDLSHSPQLCKRVHAATPPTRSNR